MDFVFSFSLLSTAVISTSKEYGRIVVFFDCGVSRRRVDIDEYSMKNNNRKLWIEKHD